LAGARCNDPDEAIKRFFATDFDNLFDVALNVGLDIRAIKQVG